LFLLAQNKNISGVFGHFLLNVSNITHFAVNVTID